MKTIGLIGGMSWESSAIYYRLINEEVKSRLGGLHSAQCLMYSVDFAEIEYLMRTNQWEELAQRLSRVAINLENAGADFMLICTNTVHKLAEQIQEAISIDLLHIADAAAEAITKKGIKKVALLGTRATMEEDFYKGRLAEKGIEVIIPGEEDRDTIHHVIFGELCLGRINPDSRKTYIRIMDELVDRGAKGIILGCTEIPLLIKAEDAGVPLFDTTYLHAMKAVDKALA
ncbi:MAG: aspartate/glutamate racemase family protein [Bacillota bacterium]|nr:aspartate/glutamate racemase family protein [Bacillota bacterium]MDW7683288.1 aspartate/glutamate racemase family protein [Bacillota bacterium]